MKMGSCTTLFPFLLRYFLLELSPFQMLLTTCQQNEYHQGHLSFTPALSLLWLLQHMLTSFTHTHTQDFEGPSPELHIRHSLRAISGVEASIFHQMHCKHSESRGLRSHQLESPHPSEGQDHQKWLYIWVQLRNALGFSFLLKLWHTQWMGSSRSVLVLWDCRSDMHFSALVVLVLNLDSSLEPPGDTLELAVGRSQSRPINTEFLGMEPRHQYCFKLSRYFQCATNTKSLWKEDHTCIWCQVLPVLFP